MKRLTPAEVRREALVRAGLRAPKEHCRDAGAHPETRIREFELNSPEAYAALCRRPDEPWIKAGSLPREPRAWPRAAERDWGRPELD